MSIYEIGKITESRDLEFVVWQGEDLTYLLFHISSILSLEIFKTRKECGNLGIFGVVGLWNGTSTDSKWWFPNPHSVPLVRLLGFPAPLCPVAPAAVSSLSSVRSIMSFPAVAAVDVLEDIQDCKAVRWGSAQKPKSQFGGLLPHHSGPGSLGLTRITTLSFKSQCNSPSGSYLANTAVSPKPQFL